VSTPSAISAPYSGPAMFISAMSWEIEASYNALMDGEGRLPQPQAGSYEQYCVRERARTAALSLESPEIRQWIDFFESNDGFLPSFPLPVADPSLGAGGGLLSVQLMDAQQTSRFEAACISAGARFSGGVFACAAPAEYQLTGAATYYAVTPTGTCSTPTEFITTGWFIGHIPFIVEVETTFGATARGAQKSFDASTHLAKFPFERVLELAPWLRTAFSRVAEGDDAVPVAAGDAK